MKKILFVLLTVFSLCCTAMAQKTVVVSEEFPYTEWIGGKPEINSYDLLLSISFKEDSNTLQVALSSTNSLIYGFRHNIVYGNVFTGCRKLGFQKLPYKVDVDPNSRLKMSKGVKKQLKPNVKQHNFNPWLEYDGMEALKEADIFPSDSLVQHFKVEPSNYHVSIHLGDCFFISRDGTTGKGGSKFSIEHMKSLLNEYDILVVRDPCRKSRAQIDSVQAMHGILSIAREQLEISFPDGTAKSLQELESFQMLRNDLLKSHYKTSMTTGCPELAEAVNSYNACVDSVLNMVCVIPDEYKAGIVLQLGTGAERVDANGLLYCSRMLDQLVAEWQIEKNKTARLSIVQECRKLIDSGTAMAIGRRAVTDADRKAIDVFAQAKEHFNKVCR